MFIDARTLPPNASINADVCIVGAGPAGLSLAQRLGAHGARIALLESGGFSFDPATQALYRGEVVGAEYWALDTARLRFFGGTSNHWTGWCRPLDAHDFEERPWVENSGWPLSAAELTDVYGDAQTICDLGPFDYAPERWSKSVRLPLLPLEGTGLETSVWQFSPPTRFGTKFRPAFATESSPRVYLYANAIELEANAKTTRVQSVLASRLDGEKLRVQAQLFVIAGGGIENARLLLSSRSRKLGGLGNASGLVGRFFLEHPHTSVGILESASKHDALRWYEALREVSDPRVAVRASLTLSPQLQQRERTLNVCIGLDPLLKSPPYAPRQAEGVRTLARRLQGFDPQRAFELVVRSEQYPEADSRVFLTGERDSLGVPRVALDWRHHPRTLQSIRRSVELVAEALGRAGIGRVYSYAHGGTPTPGAWPEITGGHHHMGTTRMHQDPRYGVVDRDCRVHSLENLYVAGSSVFPTGGYANPTLTLVALALRLGDTLARRLS